MRPPSTNDPDDYAENHGQQYLAIGKNPNGYCNHGPNGLTCSVGVARTPSGALFYVATNLASIPG